MRFYELFFHEAHVDCHELTRAKLVQNDEKKEIRHSKKTYFHDHCVDVIKRQNINEMKVETDQDSESLNCTIYDINISYDKRR